MPRRKLIESKENPYHLTLRTNNRDWFDLPMPVVWDIMERYLHFVHHAFATHVHAFVLMSNHLHLIARFPNGGLADAMQYFGRETSRSIGYATDRINHVWGGRYYRSEIRGFHHYMNVYKYVYRNPVEAGITGTVESYPYSTLPGLLGLRRLLIPVAEDTLLFGDPVWSLAWLNTAPRPDDRESMRRALRRLEFGFLKDKHTNADHPLCTRLY